jgi:hypothetical protein
MMTLIGVSILVISFVTLIKFFGLIQISVNVVNTAKCALSDLRNPNLCDDAKEIALQGYAKRLFSLFGLLTAGSITALAVPIGLIWLLEQVGILSLNAVITIVISWEFLLGSVLLAYGLFLLMKKL